MSGAELRVDLDAFAANLEAVRARVAPARVMLVVKDDAYGQGLEPIILRAREEGIDLFGTFDVDTGCAVRRLIGAEGTIFAWLTVGESEIADALAHEIDLGVGDRGYLRSVAGVAARSGSTARVHLKIDTGLHRNGIRPEEWQEVVAEAHRFETEGSIRIVGVWSHIAEASDADDDDARSVFDDAVGAAESAGLSLELRHLAASAASFARPEFRYDAVRVGAFCYGVRSAGGVGEEELGVQAIAELVAPVSEIDEVSATLQVGWLDGLPSTLAGRMRVHSPEGAHAVQEIGASQTRVERWPGAAVGDVVTVFGQSGASATDLAEMIDTVGEEILTRVSPHVPRVYR